MTTLPFDIVVAADEGGGIGYRGELQWKLPTDVAFFKRITSEAAPGRVNAVIMGRKTWETIPPREQPLSRRINVVITRQTNYAVPPGVIVAADLDAALAALVPESHRLDRVFVIGGGEIYRIALDHPACRTVYLTRVEGRFPADAFFPTPGDDYTLVDQSERHEENGVGYAFQTWRRQPEGD